MQSTNTADKTEKKTNSMTSNCWTALFFLLNIFFLPTKNGFLRAERFFIFLAFLFTMFSAHIDVHDTIETVYMIWKSPPTNSVVRKPRETKHPFIYISEYYSQWVQLIPAPDRARDPQN